MREIRTGQFYRHFKGGLYQIVGVAEHTETGEKLVIYQALYGDYKIYARPYEMFAGETDHEKYPEVTQKYRFELTVPGETVTEEPEKKEPVSVAEAQKEEPPVSGTGRRWCESDSSGISGCGYFGGEDSYSHTLQKPDG